MRANSIQTRVLRYLGRAYRKFIQDGVEINNREHQYNTKPKWKKSVFSDPLALHPDSEEVKGIGLAVNYPVDDLIMDGEMNSWMKKSSIPKQVSLQELNSSYHESAAQFAVTDESDWDLSEILKDDEEEQKKRTLWNWHGWSRLFIAKRGREIQANGTFGIYTKHPGYDYIHGMIEFPVALDRFFGVQTNKSRYKLRRDMEKGNESTL